LQRTAASKGKPKATAVEKEKMNPKEQQRILRNEESTKTGVNRQPHEGRRQFTIVGLKLSNINAPLKFADNLVDS
jgi:hypothetical protein